MTPTDSNPTPPNPNRLAQLNTATASTNVPQVVPPPGAGGWVPSQLGPMIGALVMGVLSAFGGLVAGGGALTLPLVLGAVCTGAATGLATFFGMKSAGPRQ